MQRVLQAIRPQVYLEEPDHWFRRIVFRTVRHSWFNPAITLAIVVNTVIMCMNHDQQTPEYAWVAVS